MCSVTCKCKGLGDDRIVDKMMRSISDTGNSKIVLKNDGEPALVQVQDRSGPKVEGGRWSAIAIKDMVATPDMPNPKGDSLKDARSERSTRGLDFGASGDSQA